MLIADYFFRQDEFVMN